MSSTAYDYAPSANGSVDRSAASSQRRVRQQNAYRVFPRDPACAGGAPRATARALTENAACACRVRSIGSVDTTGCASGVGPTNAGGAAVRTRPPRPPPPLGRRPPALPLHSSAPTCQQGYPAGWMLQGEQVYPAKVSKVMKYLVFETISSSLLSELQLGHSAFYYE